MSKFPFILGGAVGFVLGARAGRPTYEKIKDFAQGFASSKPVKAVGQKADETVGEYARYQATRMTDTVAESLKSKINNVGRGNKHGAYGSPSGDGAAAGDGYAGPVTERR